MKNCDSRLVLISWKMALWCALAGVLFAVTGCGPKNANMGEKSSQKLSQSEIANLDVETLKNTWVASDDRIDRNKIVSEFQRRKSVDGLHYCLLLANLALSGRDYAEVQNPALRKAHASKSRYSMEELTGIVAALGETKIPEAIKPLAREMRRIDDKDYAIATLSAFSTIGVPDCVDPVADFLKNKDIHVRLQALNTLGHLKFPQAQKYILPMLFDDDARIRWAAVNALKNIGDPEASGHIGFLLGDSDELVRNIAEITLRKFGVSEKKIKVWKMEADKVSIEDIYSSKRAYKRVELEKRDLAEEVENLKSLKKQMEDSLARQEMASGRVKDLDDSLYEKDRQLKSKQSQLDIAEEQLEIYRADLRRLNDQITNLQVQLDSATAWTRKETVQKALAGALDSKSVVEKRLKDAKQKESRLRKEIEALSDQVERARMESDAARSEIIALRNREMELTSQVHELKRRLNRSTPPILVISEPEKDAQIESQHTFLHFVAVDDKGISKVQVSLNGLPLQLDNQRGIRIVSDDNGESAKKIEIQQRIQIPLGQNEIKISVTDDDGILQEESIEIRRVKRRGHIWAIIIGINQYQKARSLKYAVNDAMAFKNYLRRDLAIAEERIFYLSDQGATKSKIESILGTTIKKLASRDDTVIIFYAGHGAVEPDPSNLDGDGFEKYLLPHDANLEDLYSTSISMNNIRTIFARIQADRLIFIADTCYSGASGGRTMLSTKARANLSDNFYDRISKGKGRIIISSCSANEISKEDDSLQHGIFSYYMLKGLKGDADRDNDKIITVSELFSYISKTVPKASSQDQHPVKKGETEGELVIGRVK